MSSPSGLFAGCADCINLRDSSVEVERHGPPLDENLKDVVQESVSSAASSLVTASANASCHAVPHLTSELNTLNSLLAPFANDPDVDIIVHYTDDVASSTDVLVAPSVVAGSRHQNYS